MAKVKFSKETEFSTLQKEINSLLQLRVQKIPYFFWTDFLNLFDIVC